MSLQRYDSVGWEEMDESPTGEFVKLQDIIKLLEEQEVEGWFDTGFKQNLIALINGENK